MCRDRPGRATRSGATARAVASERERSPPGATPARRSRAHARSRRRLAVAPNPCAVSLRRSAATRPRARRTILETTQRRALLDRRDRPAPPPLAGGRRRDTAASRRLTTRTTSFDIRDQRPPPSQSETSVTVKPHPGPSFDCEPSQTHSLEGDPDDLLSRPQPVEARHLERWASGGDLDRRAERSAARLCLPYQMALGLRRAERDFTARLGP
jgi:hypothetical protein